uniref:sorting nexin-33 isoform X3 n=1 Tax=Ciona intestinalis TaxID=7719 RepID=UPI00089DCFB6|nr:sorting nexin-33 isoform X3 [Ciona intestinalis]|eukprot:XP_018669023.1 sorting nexin-33 isoform X3 [Ciona intestinalis]
MDVVVTLYEFEGDVNNGELCFGPGERITVTNKDVGEGWWEGQKDDGTSGLFPETYVEAPHSDPTLDPSDPFGLPPPAPSELSDMDDFFGLGFAPQPSSGGNKLSDDVTSPFTADEEDILGLGDPIVKSWEEPQVAVEASAPVEQSTNNDWADDWTNQAPQQQQQNVSPTHSQRSQGSIVNSAGLGSPVKRTDRKTTVKLGNFISSLTKTAVESFVLGETNLEVPASSMVQVISGLDGPMWENNPHPFTCTVTNPVKESKFSGLKSFIAYTITPSHTDVAVLRRFKHFDWLYEQLVRKYGVSISVPQLPDKQITGRYEDDFIEGRRVQLQTWLCRIALHPVISCSDVFGHFVTSKDDEKAWKQGKRKAEKDEAVGGGFFQAINTPDQKMDFTIAEQTLDTHSKFTRGMDEACKQLIIVGQDQAKKFPQVYKKDTQRLGQLFSTLGECFELDNRPVSAPLTEAIKHTGQVYEAVGELYGNQPTYDWNPLLEGLNEYHGVLATFPAILGNQRNALDKLKEVRRLQLENKVTVDEMEDVATRTEKISYAVEAEVNHFQHYRVGDFVGYMKDFVQQQISFHQEIVKKLQDTAVLYEELM